MMSPPQIIPLWEQLPDTPRIPDPGRYCDAEDFQPRMELFLCPGDIPRPFVLICPGGGYAGRTGSERGSIAQWLNTLGMHAAVLFYRVKPWLHPTALSDGRRALQILQRRADEWNIDPEQLHVLGFSAGGHLAGCLGLVDDPLPGLPHVQPASLLLAYPVVSFTGPETHIASRTHLLGPDPDREICEQLSLERRVTSSAPPIFLWHAADDALVVAGNSLALAHAYCQVQRPCSLHVFPEGGHGLPKKGKELLSRNWTTLAGNWYQHQHSFKEDSAT